MIVKVRFEARKGSGWNARGFYYQTQMDLKVGDIVRIRTQDSRPRAIVIETGILIEEVPEAYRYRLGVITEKCEEGN